MKRKVQLSNDGKKMSNQSFETQEKKPTPQKSFVIRPGSATVRTIFQLRAVVHSDQSMQTREECARNLILDWLQEKFPVPIPQIARNGESFECNEYGQSINGVAIPQEGIWSVRIEQPDAPFLNRPAVPGRFWTTDLALRSQAETLSFGVRVQCASFNYARQPVGFSRPRIVITLADRFQLHESRCLDGKPWALSSFEDLQEFEAFLLDPSRTMPVLLLTQPDQKRLHVGVSEYLLDADWLATHLQGFGYVATMPSALGYHWTDIVGKSWSAFLGAVRTYMPKLDYDTDSPHMHPLTFPEKVLLWRYFDERGDYKGEEAFQRFLVRQFHEYGASKRMDWKDCLFLPTAKPIQLTLARQQSQDEGEWKELFEAEITSIKDTLITKEGEMNEWIEVAEGAERQRDFFSDENARLRARIAWLESLLKERENGSELLADEIPSEFDAIPEWASQNLAGKLILHPRALRSLKKAEFQDVSLVCKALLLLADNYRDKRLGVDGANESFSAGCSTLELRCSRSIAQERAGEEGETYFVTYPPHSDNRFFLKHHLRKGTNSEPKHCLAIYFFWHQESQQVVVASLPGHLPNRLS